MKKAQGKKRKKEAKWKKGGHDDNFSFRSFFSVCIICNIKSNTTKTKPHSKKIIISFFSFNLKMSSWCESCVPEMIGCLMMTISREKKVTLPLLFYFYTHERSEWTNKWKRRKRRAIQLVTLIKKDARKRKDVLACVWEFWGVSSRLDYHLLLLCCHFLRLNKLVWLMMWSIMRVCLLCRHLFTPKIRWYDEGRSRTLRK